MKVLIDMNLSPAWVEWLGGVGVEAVHWSNVGADNASDSQLMHWAADHDHIVLTSDLDFGAILAATQRRKPSVVQIRSANLAPEVIGPAVLTAIRQTLQRTRRWCHCFGGRLAGKAADSPVRR